MGVPLKIIPFNGIFPNKNHPNFGIPAFVETPITYSKIFRQPPIPQVPLSQEPLAPFAAATSAMAFLVASNESNAEFPIDIRSVPWDSPLKDCDFLIKNWDLR